jgi:RNA polymerase sigma-70 factor (sigma-E family)
VRAPDFDEFYVVLRPRLVRTAYAVCHDLGVAEDAVQNAFAKAYSCWRRIWRLESPEAYVRKMAVNEVLNTRRLARVRHEVARAVLPEEVTVDSHASVGTHGDLWQAIMALPPRQRAVLVLRYYDDLSERQIADVMGCSPGTVKSQASAAMATLRQRFDAASRTGKGLT